VSMIFIFALAAAVLGGLPALARRSWRTFAIGVAVSLFGVLLPALAFLGSAIFVPEWKGGCTYGWVDCLHGGKLFLGPIVLWAMAALYTRELFPLRGPAPSWIAAGLPAGAVVSGFCAIHGLLTLGRNEAALGLLIPFYVSVWFLVRSIQLARRGGVSLGHALVAAISMSPFWIAAIIWSKRRYLELPDTQPSGCFVVTAASRGHPTVVGPLVLQHRRGAWRAANRQLRVLWAFEARWRRKAPASHRRFRGLYNRLGPRLAARIDRPWKADMAYLLLTPVEWLAGGTLRLQGGSRKKPPRR
jgi:hypothetical protein